MRKPDRRLAGSLCRPRHNGSMPALRGAGRGIVMAATNPDLESMRGSTRTQRARRTPQVRRSRTPGGCTICTGTWRSGAMIGMMCSSMRTGPRTIPQGLQGARLAWSGAVSGAAAPGAPGRRAATATRRGGSGTTSASASPWFRRESRRGTCRRMDSGGSPGNPRFRRIALFRNRPA